MRQHIITANNLHFRYDSKQALLEGISFAIQQGDFVGIIGANGGGKSTLLKLMLGFLRPQKGILTPPQTPPLEGEGLPPTRGEYKGGTIWYIPQFSAITQDFPISIRKVVESGATHGWNFLATPPHEKINQLLEQFQLTDIADHLISEVSGGERQRALIARALVQDPDIIIADEPTSNIDIHREKEVFNIFEQLHKQGKTLIVVSHDIFLLKKYATIVFGVNRHLHTHRPEDITEKLIYESYICPDCHHQH